MNKPGILADIGELGLRLFVGLSMGLAHGLGKIPPSEQFLGGVQAMGFPLPVAFAWGAGLSELVGGLMLALGLFTRFSALSVAITMAVAAFVAHGADPYQKKEMALFYLVAALFFVLKGSGKFSLDRVIRGR